MAGGWNLKLRQRAQDDWPDIFPHHPINPGTLRAGLMITSCLVRIATQNGSLHGFQRLLAEIESRTFATPAVTAYRISDQDFLSLLSFLKEPAISASPRPHISMLTNTFPISQ